MITIEHTGNLVNVAVLGDFTLADFREFDQQVLHDIGFQGRVNLLLDLRDMVNYTLDGFCAEPNTNGTRFWNSGNGSSVSMTWK